MMHTSAGWKQTTVELTSSRDGRNWSRAGTRGEFLPLGARGEWDADYHDPCWEPFVLGDEIWIYYRSVNRQPEERTPKVGHAIGLAKIRRDGFVSLNSGDTPGRITTRPLTFEGQHLFVNAEIGEGGWIKASLLERDYSSKPDYTSEVCDAIETGGIAVPVTWKGEERVERLPDERLRISLEMKNAKIYSFWFE
jgi:hypothetical protein